MSSASVHERNIGAVLVLGLIMATCSAVRVKRRSEWSMLRCVGQEEREIRPFGCPNGEEAEFVATVDTWENRVTIFEIDQLRKTVGSHQVGKKGRCGAVHRNARGHNNTSASMTPGKVSKVFSEQRVRVDVSSSG